MQLYKAWYRQIPEMSRQYDLPVSVETARDTLREKFRSNAHIKDTRVIDMLVIKVIIFITSLRQVSELAKIEKYSQLRIRTCT